MTVSNSGDTRHSGPAALVERLTRAWSAGDAGGFSRSFSATALFVAFDGTVLRGPEAIGQYHQQAFSTHLAGTRLEVTVEEARAITAKVTVLLTHGGIRREANMQGPLIGPSVQTFVIVEEQEQFLIENFQNTRARSIKGPVEAQVWRDFDLAWGRLSESSRS